jgi:hypothetical protein
MKKTKTRRRSKTMLTMPKRRRDSIAEMKETVETSHAISSMRHAWQLKMHIGLHRLFYPRPHEANAISGMVITELLLLHPRPAIQACGRGR